MKRKLNIQTLENRSLMAGDTFDLSNGILTVNGSNGNDTISVQAVFDPVSNVGVPPQIVATVNGVSKSFDFVSVKSLVINGNDGDDNINNDTGLSSNIYGGKGNDIIKGGFGDDNMFGGAGNDIITDFAGGGGSNLLDGGDGDDHLWGGTGSKDILLGGDGNDTIYDIVGGQNVMDGGKGKNLLIGRVSDIQTSNKNDTVVSFGAGQGAVSLVNGVVYLMGDANNNVTTVSQSKGKVNVNFDGQLFTFNKSDVKMLAGIGGAGNDTFINNTNIDSVYYGAAGNDTLVGGTGKDLLKGGAGDDYLSGGAGDDDLSGDDGKDVLIPGRGKDIVRADLLDVIVLSRNDRKDIVLGRDSYFAAYDRVVF